jgi:hypothetical protein
MFGLHAPQPSIALAAVIGLAAACGAPEDPFTSGSARATVTGLATDRGGSPISGATIHIACSGGGSPVSLATDTTGHYIANLDTGSDPFDGGSGRLLCHFSEPAAGDARVYVDTALSFVRGPVLVALQFVDLREQ